MATEKTRAKIVDAFLAILAERDFSSIGLAEIAEAAEVSLGTLREAFESKLAILAAFSDRIDQATLAGGVAEGEDKRDRLFEVMMRRFDALRPHQAAVKSLARSAMLDPALVCTLLRRQQDSQNWTLAAANIHRSGLAGAVAISGVALVHAGVMSVFVDDDDPGLARTMAALDRALQRGQRAMGVFDSICSFLPRLAEKGREGGQTDATG